MNRSGDQRANIEAHQWKPGQSGNPGGRPKRQPISEAYRKFADMPIPEDLKNLKMPKNCTLAEAAAFVQYIQAIGKRDTKAINEIREAMEGKSPQRIELSGADDAPPIQIAPSLDLTKLSKEQLVQYRAILAAATRTND